MIKCGKETMRLVRALQKAKEAFIKSLREDGYEVGYFERGYHPIWEQKDSKPRQVGQIMISWRIFASIDKSRE